MTFTAQELNHRITFEEQQITRDEWGGETIAWVEIGYAFAKVEPLVGREYFAAAALQAENSVKFTMRHRDGLQSNTMRLVYDGAAWDMTSIINVKGRNRETLIYAKRLE